MMVVVDAVVVACDSGGGGCCDRGWWWWMWHVLRPVWWDAPAHRASPSVSYRTWFAAAVTVNNA